MRLIGSELGNWALIGGTWVPGTAPPDLAYRRVGHRCKGANASVIRARARDRRFVLVQGFASIHESLMMRPPRMITDRRLSVPPLWGNRSVRHTQCMKPRYSLAASRTGS